MRLNLHTHSTMSDGALSPTQLVQKLYEDGVEIFALTDHDTTNGLIEAKSAAQKYQIRLINGIEISAIAKTLVADGLNPLTDSLHLLGLGFDYEKLAEVYKEKHEKKCARLADLNKKLIEKGFRIPIIPNLEKRTQVAKALVESEYSSSIQKAFENIVNRYYDRWQDTVGIPEAVDLIHSTGGLILWAHPFEILKNNEKVHLKNTQIDDICAQLKTLGIDGIEAFYETYDRGQTDFLESLQKKYKFIASAGTDYHGKRNQPHTFIDIDPEKIKEVLK